MKLEKDLQFARQANSQQVNAETRFLVDGNYLKYTNGVLRIDNKGVNTINEIVKKFINYLKEQSKKVNDEYTSHRYVIDANQITITGNYESPELYRIIKEREMEFKTFIDDFSWT
jgi:hypothetical protein